MSAALQSIDTPVAPAACQWLNRCHFGDVRDVLRLMIADGVQVQTIVTSPPYWGLRSYLPAGHPDKPREIGSEPTLADFLDTMVEVFGLARQVLRDDGTMWVNMGDSYASNAGGYDFNGSKTLNAIGSKRQQAIPRGDRTIQRCGLKPKDLIGQPWRLAFALQDAGWWLRQDIIWHKPNPMPESIKDRCTKAHEYVFLLAKSERYYFDQHAIRTPLSAETKAQSFETMDYQARDRYKMPDGLAIRSARDSFKREDSKRAEPIPGQTVGTHRPDRAESAYDLSTANKRSVWTVATEAYPGSHYATYPRALIEPCVLAGAPAGGIVLDLFMGSGTTAQVAEQLGRQWIGIDIDERNAALQAERLRQPSLLLEQAA